MTHVSTSLEASPWERTGGGAVDILLVEHAHLPRGPLGDRRSPAGRPLLRQAAAALRHVDVSHELRVDELRRWLWPGLGLFGSVSHVGRWSATALSDAGPVGVDLQDERDRPGALTFLGGLIGSPGAATLREYAECESLVKATPLTKATFGGVRLPDWSPEWRAVREGWWLRSSMVPGVGALAVTATGALPVRWWRAWSPAVGSLTAPIPMTGPARRTGL